MTIPAGARLGLYEVLAPLGAGGMGEVYRGRDTRLGREVALKVLPEALASDRDRISRFEQEARAASALNHPNIVTIHEIGREGETAFIAMELVDGKTLRELCASGSMPVRKILNVAAQVAEGLAKAHAAGIVHRDLKPENVMVSRDGFVKILDFGLAKLVEPESGEVSAMPTLARPETHAGVVLGTVAYMSPEQASGAPVDFRSDQFSLGSMLYEMSTGQKAFPRKTAAETMSAIIRDEPEPIARLRPDLPLPMRWILERCLAKEADERYGSTRDLARDLASVRDHISEVSSGAEALLASPGKPRRRTAAAIVGIAGLAAGLAAGWALTRSLLPTTSSPPSFQRATFRRGVIGNARFAPDGQTIVYGASWRGEPGGLYQTRLGSPESRLFDVGLADILSISRTGELAILQRTVGGPEGMLAVLPMVGGVPRKLLSDVWWAGADWAPDGKGLAVVHTVNGKDRLEFPIGTVILAENAGNPRFSPSGDLIAHFEDRPGGGGAIGVVDPGGKSRRILSDGWTSWGGVPSWTRNGREVWFTASHAGETDALWAVDRSGKRRLVTRVPGDLELYDIAPDGRVLLAHHDVTFLVRGLGAGQKGERDLEWLDGSEIADLSSDGKVLLTEMREAAGSTHAVYLRGIDGSAAVKLGEGRGLAISPDGLWVLAVAGESPALVLLPTGAGETRTLERGDLRDFRWGAWLPDGRSVVFSASGAGGGERIYVQAVSGGKARAVSPEGYALDGSTSPVSPDGKRLLVRSGAKWSLLPIEGAASGIPISGLEPEDTPIQWSSDSRSLYLSRQGEAAPKVWLFDLTTGRRQLWKQLENQGLVTSPRIRVSPDGSLYAYGGVAANSELYVVSGLR